MRPVAAGLILSLLALSIFGPPGSFAGDPAAQRAKVLQLSQKARDALAFMDKKTRQVLAFCDLAAKAALIFPSLARDYYQKALSAAQYQGSREYLLLAARLKSAAAQSARAMSLSRELEERGLGGLAVASGG